MSDEVLVTTAALLNDHLGVPQDEATEHKETSPQVGLKEKGKCYALKFNFKKSFRLRSQGGFPRETESEESASSNRESI